jgi:hypothetical protein
MARFLRNRGVAVTTLTKAQARDGNNGADLGGLTQTQRDALLRDTPLWFYILREAELGGGKLRGVSARIVAETFHRAMEGSQISIVRAPTWRTVSRSRLDDFPDGRPPPLRLPGEESSAGPARRLTPQPAPSFRRSVDRVTPRLSSVPPSQPGRTRIARCSSPARNSAGALPNSLFSARLRVSEGRVALFSGLWPGDALKSVRARGKIEVASAVWCA